MRKIYDVLGVAGISVFVVFLFVVSASSFWHYGEWVWQVSRHIPASQEGWTGLWIGLITGGGAVFFGRLTWNKIKKMIKRLRHNGRKKK